MSDIKYGDQNIVNFGSPVPADKNHTCNWGYTGYDHFMKSHDYSTECESAFYLHFHLGEDESCDWVHCPKCGKKIVRAI